MATRLDEQAVSIVNDGPRYPWTKLIRPDATLKFLPVSFIAGEEDATSLFMLSDTME